MADTKPKMYLSANELQPFVFPGLDLPTPAAVGALTVDALTMALLANLRQSMGGLVPALPLMPLLSNTRPPRAPRRKVIGKLLLKCATCEYTSYRAHHMKRHEATHNRNYKPYKCEFCEQSFARSDQKRPHQLSRHLKDIALMCPHCARVSRDQTEFDAHLETHRYPCAVCHETFSTLKKLRFHERSHGVFRCRCCEFLSREARKVARHEQAAHGFVANIPPSHDLPLNLAKDNGLDLYASLTGLTATESKVAGASRCEGTTVSPTPDIDQWETGETILGYSPQDAEDSDSMHTTSSTQYSRNSR